VRFETYGDDDDPTVLLVLGFGNRPEHEHVGWLLDRLAESVHLHVAVLPIDMTDFESDYRRPVERYASGLELDAVVSHSTGGLIAAHLPLDAPRIYLSPWWGINFGGVGDLLFPFFRRLPTGYRFLPTGADPEAIGDLKTPAEAADGPDFISPAFLREIDRAQRRLPAFRPESLVFCSLTDRVVSVRAIGERAPPARVRLYHGGHEFFASSGREAVYDDLLAALLSGPRAVEGPTLDAR
jgi:hypothetical protein